MGKKFEIVILLACILTITVGCQKKESSSSSFSTSSKSSQKKQNSALKIERISAEEYQKLADQKNKGNKVVFFETPGLKKDDEALKKFAGECQNLVEKLYTVDISTDEGKKLLEENNLIKGPFDAVILKKNRVRINLDLQHQKEIQQRKGDMAKHLKMILERDFD